MRGKPTQTCLIDEGEDDTKGRFLPERRHLLRQELKVLRPIELLRIDGVEIDFIAVAIDVVDEMVAQLRRVPGIRAIVITLPEDMRDRYHAGTIRIHDDIGRKDWRAEL